MSLYDSILITGGAGMLGTALTDVLKSQSRRPLALGRGELDIADSAAVARAFTIHKPTLVLNCAAHTKVDQCEIEPHKADLINGYAVGELAAHCRDTRAVLVHISTDFVFDGAHRRPYRTDDPTNPLSAYGRSKLLGETELRKNAPLRWLIIRTAWVYGRNGPNFPRTMVTAARAGKTLRVVNDQFGSPTYTIDLAQAIVALLDSNAHGLWHLTNAGHTTWYDFAKAALAQFGIDSKVDPVSSSEWAQMRPNTAVRPSYSVLDTNPYTRQTGLTLRPWHQALADYHTAVEKNGF